MLIKISRRLFAATKFNDEVKEFLKDFSKVKDQYTPKPKIPASSEWNENLKEDWDEYIESWHEQNPVLSKSLRYEIDGQDPHYEYPLPKEHDYPPIPDAPTLKHKILLPQAFYFQNPETIASQLIGKVIEHNSKVGVRSGIITSADVCKSFKVEDEKPGILGMSQNKHYLFIFAEDDEGEVFSIHVSSIKLIGDNLQKTAKVTDALNMRPLNTKNTSILYDPNSPIRIYEEGYTPVKVENEYNMTRLLYRFYCEEFTN